VDSRTAKDVGRKAIAWVVVFSAAVAGLGAQAPSGGGGSIVVPAWSFLKGNVRIHADTNGYADAGPVLVSGPERPWGWSVEFEFSLPVAAKYTLQVCYASEEARPVHVYLDSKYAGTCCKSVTFVPGAPGEVVTFSGKSSAAKWEAVKNEWGRPVVLEVAEGEHIVRLASRRPLPHLVGIRLDTPTPFPQDWQPPEFKVRDPESIPPAYRAAFAAPNGPDAPALLRPPEETTVPKRAASLEIPAWTFDRGNARIYASPDEYADAGPLVGSDPDEDNGFVEYDIEFPADAECTLTVRYAAAEPRPLEVFLGGKSLGWCCTGVAFGSAPFEQPMRFTWNSRGALKNWEGMRKDGKLVRFKITKGKHTLRLARRGPLPHLMTLRLDASAPFPRGWKPPERKVRHIERVPVTQRSVFLPADAVNIGALRLAIQETIAQYGAKYPRGPEFLRRLAELEKKQREAENAAAEEKKDAPLRRANRRPGDSG